MQITLILFVSSVNQNSTMSEVLTKTIESDIRLWLEISLTIPDLIQGFIMDTR
ncbi:hypothetical protein [Bacillus sp. JCM 19041]|uniref:hypothetical protein n=1 Tax=Bacillus sp. JCM 19041 TaxID=1460637 RepID=UPI000A4670E2